MKRIWPFLVVLATLLLAACTYTPPAAPATGSSGSTAIQTATIKPFVIGAIPDQDPEILQRLYDKVADYLSAQLGVPVEYRPVTDYTAAVTAFKVGDLDMVWFGGLTGVQARLQVPGAQAIAQRNIDEQFHSVFIANRASGIEPIDDISQLATLKGHTFTFGSDSSTSGRLMPQYYLQQAEVSLSDFKGEPGFSGSHDATIKLVEAGSFDAGVLNEQVWQSRTDAGEVDLSKVQVIWRTPAYYDYHWIVRPDVEERYGQGFTQRVQNALLALNPDVPEQKEILDLFRAEKFILTQNSNYDQIEAVGREIGRIR
jgi:phosphonate transport system substrate-binding protein